MPKKLKTVNAETVATPLEETTSVTPQTEVVEPVKKTKKSSKKTPKNTITVDEQVEPVPDLVEDVSVAKDEVTECSELGVCPAVDDAPVKKTRRSVTKQDIIQDLDVVFTEVITTIKDKSLVKKVKQLKSDLVKLFKLRNATRKDTDNPNSGFRKPVDVSPEMRKFLNLPPTELTRRLDITKKLCDYIKENNLQDEKDRRNIIPDHTLQKLLSITDSDPPLTYYSIQQKLKPHIIKV